MWQIERNGEMNSFTISAYMVEGGRIVLTQNWHNGDGIHLYLPDGEITFQGSRKKVEQLIGKQATKQTVPGQLSNERRLDMLTGAMEGGSNYWYFFGEDAESVLETYIYDLASRRKGQPFVDLIWEAIRAGASIPIRDTEDPKTILGRISMQSIEEGERLMAEQEPSHLGDILSESDDATTADVWFQYAVLKELVYG